MSVGTEPNTTNAIGHLRSIAASAGVSLTGIGTEPNFTNAFFILKKIAEEGDFGGGGASGGIVRIPASGAAVAYPPSADTNAARGAALEAARDDASAEDLIRVGNGTYEITSSLARDGVNWYFDPGAAVIFPDDVSLEGIWDDGGASMSYVVSGHGSFTRSSTTNPLEYNLIKCSHASSNVVIHAQDLLIDAPLVGTGAGFPAVVDCRAGTLKVVADTIKSIGDCPYAVWWVNGSMNVRAFRIESGYFAVGSQNDDAPTGEGVVHAQEIYGVVQMGGSNAAAAYWVTANIITGILVTTNISDAGGGIDMGSSGRFYVNAQKIRGKIACGGSDGQLYVNTEKVSATSNGGANNGNMISANGFQGTAILEVRHLDPGAYTGEMVTIDGAGAGVVTLNGVRKCVGGASAKGIVVTSGALLLSNSRVDTQANSSHNPLTLAGGTVTLEGVVLLANAGRDSIAAGSAQSVKVYNGVANKAVSGNVTQQVGALTVSANVA